MINSFQKLTETLLSRKAELTEPVVLRPVGKERGCVVLSYITWPFREGWDSPKARGHTNAFEVVAMAEAWRDQGFRVEVCDHDDAHYRPPADCRVAIDLHSNLERWMPDLPGSCLKILHATGCHWRFQNEAEMRRLESVRQRRGVSLEPRRQVRPSRSAEFADHIVTTGNYFTAATFAFTGKPVTRIPLSSAYEFAWPEGRDFEQAKKNFFWLGSYGMVHKGLDLVLEAFAGMPDLQLTVCGRPEKEEDFYRLYEKELTRTSNIRFRGWLDMSSPEFGEIAKTHAAVIYPSCSEGGGGSVIHCMHAGMLPVSTEESSVDLLDFGFPIRDASVEAIRKAARQISDNASSEAEQRARKAREHVLRIHTRENFARSYAAFAAAFAS